jgi:excisionase family DNA binding protein
MTQRPEPDVETLLWTSEAAALAGISRRTLYRYEEQGFITSLRTPSGLRRYRRSDVEALRPKPRTESVA